MHRTLVAVFTLVSISAAAAQVPARLGYQGRLLNADGTAETGVVDMTFAIFDVEDGGVAWWSETQSIALTNGYYATFLGETKALDLSVIDGRDLFLEVRVAGETLTPRQRVGSVAYAIKARDAANVTGGVVDASRITVGGNTVIDSSGALVGSAAYSAGDGLELSAGVFSLLRGCAPDQSLVFDGTSWVCASAVSSVTASAPLVSSSGAAPDVSLPQAGSVADGYLSSTDWTRFNDKLSSVATSVPLGGAGTSASPLSIARATSLADGYLAAADFSAFDAKVSSVSAGTGVSVGGTAQDPAVSVVYGASAGTAAEGNDPRLSDARAPTAGSGDYVQNQTAAAQAASFRIGGDALVGGRVGVGTASPSDALEVVGNARISGGGNRFYRATDSAGTSYDLIGVDSSDFIQIGPGGDGLGGMRFFPTAGPEAVRIENSGDVGIGTDAPQSRLHVQGSGNVRARISTTTASVDALLEMYSPATTRRGIVGWKNSADAPTPTGMYLWNTDNSSVLFGTTDAERMRITAGGSVGIGTTNPVETLDVAGGVRAETAFRGADRDTVYGNICRSGAIPAGGSGGVANLNNCAGNGKVGIMVCSLHTSDVFGQHVYKVFFHAHGQGYNDYGPLLISRLTDGGLTLDAGSSSCNFANATAGEARWVVKQLPIASYAATMAGY